MKYHRPTLLFVVLALAATAPYSIAQQSQRDAEPLHRQLVLSDKSKIQIRGSLL